MSIDAQEAAELRAQVNRLNNGERQFLANHMFKHYRVLPQKVRNYVPDGLLFDTPEVELGDLIRVEEHDTGWNKLTPNVTYVVVKLDQDDPDQPFAVFAEDAELSYEWVNAKQKPYLVDRNGIRRI